MANKTIYICDKCESYCDKAEIIKLEISLTNTAGYHYGNNNSRGTSIPRREICLACAQKIFEEFHGSDSTTELTARLFEGYTLPEKRSGN